MTLFAHTKKGGELEAEVRNRLLASMQAGRLVVLCGAGLSMAAPSSLPAAWRVANACFDRYQLEIDPAIDPAMRDDLEALAQHFVGLETLKPIFIETLVPWDQFVCRPNPGHAAVADFLITRTAAAALSANYDELIERSGKEYGFDFRASIDGDQATLQSHRQSPLLKFHGCATIDRAETVWAPSQLETSPLRERIARSKAWMAANLRHKDLLVVGFWSDWSYLNGLFAQILDGIAPTTVTVIDPSPATVLESKAPALWELAHGDNVNFHHVQESGAEALDELRRAFSASYLRLVLAAGRSTFETMTGVACDPSWLSVDPFNADTLYDLRRDAEGVPHGKPAKLARPVNCELLGVCHLLMRRAGAAQTSQGYVLGGKSIRVVNGAGKVLNSMKADFPEPPVVPATDVVVAPGAEDFSLPSNVVREGRAGDFMRPSSAARWLTLNQACEELGL
jgi:hypothetical protein